MRETIFLVFSFCVPDGADDKRHLTGTCQRQHTCPSLSPQTRLHLGRHTQLWGEGEARGRDGQWKAKVYDEI